MPDARRPARRLPVRRQGDCWRRRPGARDGTDSDRPPAPSPVPAPVAVLDAARERVVPMSPLRKTVARRLVEAQQTTAILTTFNEVDMGKVLALRDGTVTSLAPTSEPSAAPAFQRH